MRSVIIIPARLASTRLPNKPLADICGKPMVYRVWERAVASGIKDVYVACDHEDIKHAIEEVGGKVILTDPELPSGSDRISAAAQRLSADYDVVVNLQGDLPLFEPSIIQDVLKPLEAGFDVGTLVAPLKDEDRNSPSAVTVALSGKESDVVRRAHYFSRSKIPYGEGFLHHHMGIYAYKRQALEQFVATPPCELEKRESLEQLRALEIGLTIGVAQVDSCPMEVNTPEELERVCAAFTEV